MKQTIITAFPTFRRLPVAFLLTFAILAVYGQTDSTKVKKKKEDKIALYGTVADGFTKAAIPDVKVILMHEDSTVIDTMTVWESHSWSSGLGRSLGTTRFYFRINHEPPSVRSTRKVALLHLPSPTSKASSRSRW